MKKVKLISAFILAIVVLIVVLQNRESVETRILFATITMPRAALLFLTTAIGFGIGILVSFVLSKRKAGPENMKK